jgi:hypothetical protein
MRAMRKTMIFAAVALTLAGCTTSETIHLRNSTGQVVQCGPYTHYGNMPAAGAENRAEIRDCVADFQRQGYDRVPN